MLELKDLTVTKGSSELIKALSFRLEASSRLAILGANGSGKTSLLHVMAGIEKPAGGEVVLEGLTINSRKPKARARQVGILTQNLNFNFPAEVYEYAAAARFPYLKRLAPLAEQDKTIINNALDFCALKGKRRQNILTLSGGERQRLALASLLIQDPQIMCMDEPLNNLDIKHRDLVKKIIANYPAKLFIIVLHDLILAGKLATHLLIIKNGVTKFGSKDDLYNRETMEWLFDCRVENIGEGFLTAGL